VYKCPTCGAPHRLRHNDNELNRLLISAFEHRSEPLNRDVIITRDVTAWIAANSAMRPSSKSVGKRLCANPINGISIRFRAGTSVCRAIILRNRPRWIGAQGKDLAAHIEGSDDVDDLLM
jgi:hypothetical protein